MVSRNQAGSELNKREEQCMGREEHQRLFRKKMCSAAGEVLPPGLEHTCPREEGRSSAFQQPENLRGMGQGHSPVIKSLPRMHEALGSVPSIVKPNWKETSLIPGGMEFCINSPNKILFWMTHEWVCVGVEPYFFKPR
jgi:hypothetical protein